MSEYSVVFNETEEMAMRYVCGSVEEWINNACHERARIAIEEAVNEAIRIFLENNENIPSSRSEIIRIAYERGYIRTLAERSRESLDSLKSM